MKKGRKIKNVVVDNDGTVTAYDTCGDLIKLTRSQRHVLSMKTKSKELYFDAIRKEFQNPHCISDEFMLIRNGKTIELN